MNIEESIIHSLDGDEIGLLPFIPYILQDVKEIGADPREIIQLISKNIENVNTLSVVDLGCGKGAISVALAKEFGCKVYGIDALSEFIDSAKDYANEQGVEKLCQFEVGDIRLLVNNLSNFDIVILGAIGSVLGSEYETLTKVRKILKKDGYLVLDHGFTPDGAKSDYNKCCTETEFYSFIEQAGFKTVEERRMNAESIKESNTHIFNAIEKRSHELMIKYPKHENIFRDYVDSQRAENGILENEIICGTWLLRVMK